MKMNVADHLNRTFEAAKCRIVLQRLFSLNRSNNGSLTFKFNPETDSPIYKSDTVDCLQSLADDGIIELPSLEKKRQRVGTVTIKIPPDFDSKYQDAIRRWPLFHDELSSHKQMNFVYQQLQNKSRFLGKQIVVIGNGDLGDGKELLHINLHRALLSLEADGKISIHSIQAIPPVHWVEFPNSNHRKKMVYDLLYEVNVQGSTLRGDNYMLDMNRLLITFDDGHTASFKVGTESYRFFALFAQDGKRSVSNEELVSLLSSTTYASEQDIRDAAKGIRLRVRSRVLHAKSGSAHDIIRYKNQMTSLRGM